MLFWLSGAVGSRGRDQEVAQDPLDLLFEPAEVPEGQRLHALEKGEIRLVDLLVGDRIPEPQLQLPLALVDPADGTEVDPVEGPAIADDQVGRVGVGVERPVAHRLLQDGPQQDHRGPARRDPPRRPRLEHAAVAVGGGGEHLSHRHAVDALQGEHGAARQLAVHPGRVVRDRVGGHLLVEVGGVHRLAAEVELVDDRAGEVVDQAAHIEAPQHREEVQHPGAQAQEAQVDADAVADPRLQHLDDHLVAVGKHRAVHLRQRGRGQRFGPERRERLGNRPAQAALDLLHDLRGGHGTQGVEELAELLGVLERQQVVAGCEQLPDLHVAAAAGLEVPAQQPRTGSGTEEIADEQQGCDDDGDGEQPHDAGDRENPAREPGAHG